MKSYVCITGAAGGLGKAFATECASRGWNLYLTDLSADSLAAVAGGLARMYAVDIRTYPCDLTDPEARQAFWEQVREQRICFHFLVNVAGLDFEGPFFERSNDELRKIMRLNIEATVEMTRSSLGFNAPDRHYQIVNVCSLAAFYPMPVKAVYAASKRFLLDFSLALNEELKPRGVSVLALCPAGLPTTVACIEKINAQGWMGRVTTMNVGQVATRTIDLALQRRAIYIPGILNQVLRILGGFFPATLIASLVGRRWQDTRRRSILPVQRAV
ncbi:MAG: SDR family NAD(P)-dependent oxidoreductase [Anaerolineales bacterium]|nr:SDR family NAD(P)-dependent oxidoreductase [Anaerolineales bacterium]